MSTKAKMGFLGGGGLLLLSLIGTLILSLPLDRTAVKSAETLLNGFFSSIQERMGITISYGRASPSILGTLSLASLELDASDSRNLARAGRFSVSFDLPSLLGAVLGKNTPEGSLKRVTIRNADLTIDLAKDADLIQTLRASLQSTESGSPGEGMARPLEIAIRRARLEVRDSERGAVWTTEIRSMDLSVSDREIYISFQGTLSGNFSLSGQAPLRVAVPVRLRGNTNKNFTLARFTVSLAAKSTLGSLESQEFAVLVKDGLLEARKVRDEAPFDLYVLYDTASHALEADTRFESLALSRLVRPGGAYARAMAPWFRGPYTGHISLKNEGSWENTDLVVDLQGSLPKEVFGSRSAFRLAAAGSPQLIQLTALEVQSPDGGVNVSGSFQPNGASTNVTADFDYRFLGGRLPVRSRVQAVGEGNELFLYSERTEAGGVEFANLAVFATRDSGSFDIRGSLNLPAARDEPSHSSSGSGEDSAGGLVSWEGLLTTGKKAFLEGALEIGSYDLAPLAPLLETAAGPTAAGILKNLSIQGRITATSDMTRFSYAATDFRIARSGAGGTENYALVSLSGTRDSLNVSRLHASLGDAAVNGRLDASFGESGGTTFRSEFKVGDTPYSLEGEYDNSRLFITGDYDFYLASMGSAAGMSGMLKFRDLPVPLKQGTMLVTAEISGDQLSTDDWNARISRLELQPQGDLAGRVPAASVTGLAVPGSVRLNDVRLLDPKIPLEGTAEVSWSVQGLDEPIRLSLDLSRGTEESIRLEGAYQAGSIAGAADFQSFLVSRVFGEDLAGALSGSLSVSGSPKDPKADFALTLKDGMLRRKDFSLAAEGSVDRGEVSLRDVSARYGIHQAQGVRVNLAVDTGRLSVQGGYAGFLVEETVRFRLEAEGSLGAETTASNAFPDISRLLADVELNGRILDFSMGNKRNDDWPFRLSVHERSAVFQGGPASEVNVQILDDGSFLARAVPPFPLSAIVVGKAADSQITMDLSSIRMEMPVLWALIPVPDVRFLSGTAQGSLSVRGNASDPEIFGSLNFQDAVLEVPEYVNAPIGPVTAPLEAGGRTVTLIQPVVNIGSTAKASVSLSFEMSQWIPRSFSLRARSLQSTQIPIKTRFLGLSINGAADADISLAIENSLLSLTGNLLMPRAEIVIDPSIIQSGGEEGPVPRSDTRIDLGIQMGKGVTVYFPSKEFPVIQGQADPSSRLSVWYDDREQSFALRGNAVLRGGNLFYIQRNFYLKSGKMVFNENQYSFDPRVTLEAELRTRDEDESIRIILRAENQSLLNLQPTLESVPSLTQAEIAALLGSELLAAGEGSEIDLRRTLIASTDIIPQLNFVNIFQRNTQRLLGLDIFYLRTEIVQRWLLDVANLDAGIRESGTLADYLDNTSIFAGKYIRDDVFFHGMLQLQQDQPLVNKSTLRLDSEIGFELTTPFFLFDWSLALLHPEDLFISDNSFSFSWRLSY